MESPHEPSTLTPASDLARLSEAALLEACRKGSMDAYEQLFMLHGPKMKSIARNLMGSLEDAEDAVQEAFLRVCRGLAGFHGQSSFSTWAYRILVNACHDLRRRGQRRLEAVDTQRDFEGHVLDRAASPAPDHPLRLALEKSVAELSEAQRGVFLLYEVEGFSHAEIAVMLGISEGSSRTRLFDARRALRCLLTAGPDSAGKTEP